MPLPATLLEASLQRVRVQWAAVQRHGSRAALSAADACDRGDWPRALRLIEEALRKESALADRANAECVMELRSALVVAKALSGAASEALHLADQCLGESMRDSASGSGVGVMNVSSLSNLSCFYWAIAPSQAWESGRWIGGDGVSALARAAEEVFGASASTTGWNEVLRLYVVALLSGGHAQAVRMATRLSRMLAASEMGEQAAALALSYQAVAHFLSSPGLLTHHARWEDDPSLAGNVIADAGAFPEWRRRLMTRLCAAALASLSQAAVCSPSSTTAATLLQPDLWHFVLRLHAAAGECSAPLVWLGDDGEEGSEGASRDGKATTTIQSAVRSLLRLPWEREALLAEWRYRRWKGTPATHAAYALRRQAAAIAYLQLLRGILEDAQLRHVDDWVYWQRALELCGRESAADARTLSELLCRATSANAARARLTCSGRAGAGEPFAEQLLEYFVRYGDRPCCRYELLPGVRALCASNTGGEAAARWFQRCDALLPSLTPAHHCTRWWLQYWAWCDELGADAAASTRSCIDSLADAIGQVGRWSAQGPQPSPPVSTEVTAADDLLLLYALWVARSAPQATPAHLLSAVVVLRAALRGSPHHTPLRLASIGLYNALNAPCLARREFDALDCKYLQWDTLGYLLGDAVDMLPGVDGTKMGVASGAGGGGKSARCGTRRAVSPTISSPESPCVWQCVEALAIDNVLEVPPYIVSALRSGTLDTAVDLVLLHRRVAASVRVQEARVQRALEAAMRAGRADPRSWCRAGRAGNRRQKVASASDPETLNGLAGRLSTAVSVSEETPMVDNSDWRVLRFLFGCRCEPSTSLGEDGRHGADEGHVCACRVPSAPHFVDGMQRRWIRLRQLLLAGARGQFADQTALASAYAALGEADAIDAAAGDWAAAAAAAAAATAPLDYGQRREALVECVHQVEACVQALVASAEEPDGDTPASPLQRLIGEESDTAPWTDRQRYVEMRRLFWVTLAQVIRVRWTATAGDSLPGEGRGARGVSRKTPLPEWAQQLTQRAKRLCTEAAHQQQQQQQHLSDASYLLRLRPLQGSVWPTEADMRGEVRQVLTDLHAARSTTHTLLQQYQQAIQGWCQWCAAAAVAASE
ncbi:hypothetical protein CDCA_CDCA18G4609 [Cyanidium caldarium]|uniref:Nuclear pore complex protein Nup85 n=1 Tax=Cyanidium caldarium TaxID=2771 RepID=A0AAV9J208_CYACA|nr:hypothetical protein CDCA_CDCA18G4609 [Cyanidium caldarium]